MENKDCFMGHVGEPSPEIQILREAMNSNLVSISMPLYESEKEPTVVIYKLLPTIGYTVRSI